MTLSLVSYYQFSMGPAYSSGANSSHIGAGRAILESVFAVKLAKSEKSEKDICEQRLSGSYMSKFTENSMGKG